jgi:hypothetical protein
LLWNVGFSWDRNKDANILNRYVAFFGLGHVFWSRPDLHFETAYGLSYTRREEERIDPEKDREFPGLRLSSSYGSKLGGVTTLGNDWASNLNATDFGDWNFDTTTWLTVAINTHLALKVSLQWLYNGRPALQDIEVLAILPKEVEIDFGTVRIPKETLDTILNTSVVITF